MSDSTTTSSESDGRTVGHEGVLHVARKDLEDAARSKLLIGVFGVLLLLGVVLAVVPYLVGETGEAGAELSASLLQTPVGIFLPVLGAMVGYMAIINERDSGSIRVLLGLPLRRSDVVFGKAIGRSIVLIGALVLAGVVGVLLSMVLYGTVNGEQYAAFGILGALLSLVYVSLAVGVSASLDSRGKAMGTIAALLLLFVYAWQFVVFGIMRVVEGNWIPREVPNYAIFLMSIEPGTAATRVANFVLGDAIPDPFEGMQDQIGEVPWYLDQWVAIPILLLWIVVPLAIGYYSFENADL